MSRIFEALQRANPELNRSREVTDTPEGVSRFVATLSGEYAALEDAPRFTIPDSPERRLIAWSEPNSMAGENLRALSARFRTAQQRRALKTLLVTSAIPGDGKSTISANLAITLATHGEKTLVVDGDLHQPTLSKSFGVNGDRGLATWHENREPIVDLLQRAEGIPLWFLPAGVCQSQAINLVQNDKTAELLKQLSSWFSCIVIDSPPLVPLADSSVWATMSDAVVLVARQGLTPKKALLKAAESIDRSKLFGIVLNDTSVREERYYKAYYSGRLQSSASNTRSGS